METLVVQQKDIRQVVGLSYITIAKLEKEGKFPKRRKLSLTRVGWLAEEVREWVRQLPVGEPYRTVT